MGMVQNDEAICCGKPHRCCITSKPLVHYSERNALPIVFQALRYGLAMRCTLGAVTETIANFHFCDFISFTIFSFVFVIHINCFSSVIFI